jgi:ABC-type polysaccharide/polyol phosphate transport system ATPase subunit
MNPAKETLSPIEGATGGTAPGPKTPLAIQVEDLHKSFRLPTHRVDSLKERVVRPFAARDYKELRALDGISFDIRRGEFFGIVGRNGSGKSTLLKLLASIYRADRGTIRLAGRLAPFIELGVGFNPELTARENVVLNGVMMGLTPGEMREGHDPIIEFAELEEFADMKLKNFSSGMLVRLAFSVMMEAEADILLIDEVLAVGDAAFQQKCTDAFHSMKAQGKTIVLVTHEMGSVESLCHRAMLIDSGRIRHIGDPAQIGREYLKLNFERGSESGETATERAEGARLIDCWLEDRSGRRVTAIERGDDVRLAAELVIDRPANRLGIGFTITNADGLGLFELSTPVVGPEGEELLEPGQKVVVRATVENAFAPGRHFVHLGARSDHAKGVDVFVHNAFDFVVFGSVSTRGVVALKHEIGAEVSRGDDR